MRRRVKGSKGLRIGALLALLEVGLAVQGFTFSLVPSEAELEKFRRSWNPSVHGPLLTTKATAPQSGTIIIRPGIVGQIGNGRFENTLTTRQTASPFNSDSVLPKLILGRGLTDSLFGAVALTGVYWTASELSESGGGISNSSVILRYRPIIEDPDTWKPSIALYSNLTLPTGKWFGTPSPPGDFLPISDLPTTRTSSVSLTEGLLTRKLFRPFILAANVYYTYHFSGRENGRTTFDGDIIQVRLAFEHVLDEQQGFGYSLELLTKHGLPFRLDGQQVNTIPGSFSLFGFMPSIEYNFTPNVRGAFGVVFTLAGQNEVDAIYPTINVKYYHHPD